MGKDLKINEIIYNGVDSLSIPTADGGLATFVDEENASGGGGVELPTLSNPATESQILAGYEAISPGGEVVTGTFEALLATMHIKLLENCPRVRLTYVDGHGTWYQRNADLEDVDDAEYVFGPYRVNGYLELLIYDNYTLVEATGVLWKNNYTLSNGRFVRTLFPKPGATEMFLTFGPGA